MEITIITFCLIGAVFANPISYNFLLESSDLDANSTESLSISQSSENSTSEIQSSEENSSNQSSESSESLESTSEDKTSEESKSQSDEDDGINSVDETRDDSMGSEENVRKQSWVQAFAGVTNDLSAEDNSSTEVKGQTEHLTDKQSTHKKAFKQRIILPLEESTSDSSDTTSESAEITVATAAPSDSSESSSSETTGATAAPSDSSESSSSETTGATAAPSDSKDSTSSESSESSDTSDSSDTSKSTEDSDASDSAEVEHITTKDCVNGTQSCESEEYVFQDIGDDGHHALDNLMVPDDDERELSLRR
ncbi:secretory calcium-binding phosphoprotein 1 isoform X1 [Solea solea]|uniref:secretory calcium-binding phosphoprotein 1 isoform X1 n=1 Tax=Solea solea TaxID=90069 RepID=UPI002729A262|nr:secretory calcium-binding phosphoprotein 1 isoform X1 [Solea solea]